LITQVYLSFSLNHALIFWNQPLKKALRIIPAIININKIQYLQIYTDPYLVMLLLFIALEAI
jgi:hypothetical protein